MACPGRSPLVIRCGERLTCIEATTRSAWAVPILMPRDLIRRLRDWNSSVMNFLKIIILQIKVVMAKEE